MPAFMVHTALLAHVGHVDQVSVPGPGVGPGLAGLVLVALPLVGGAVLLARSRNPLLSTVVLFSAAAGFIHAMITPEHFQEGALVGLFTLAMTLGQMAVVVLALNRPSRALWRGGLVGNMAVLAIWAASRSTGLPVGSAPWTAEPVGLLDLACAAYEVALIASCGRLLAECRFVRPGRKGRSAPATLGAVPAS